MKPYYYKCFNCQSEYTKNKIESNFIYLCPKCGKNEKNKPLLGVLELVYDYDYIKTNVSKDSFLNNNVGRLWDYLYLWPLEITKNGLIDKIDMSILNKLELNSNVISSIDYGSNKILIFDDTRNLTLSYKDRASILVALKAIQLGINEISAASTGNAGSSLAGICARLGLHSHIFVPKSIPENKRIQIQAFGASIYIVDGYYDNAFDLCLDISQKKKWYNRNTAYNPLTIEGKKSSVFDMFIELQGNMPNQIFVPVGDGVIIAGIYKGLKELFDLGWIEKLPKLIAVQSDGSNALFRFLRKGIFEYREARTIADSIAAGAPRNLFMAAEAIKKTNGDCVVVSDSEIIESQKILTQNYGILSEPAAAASLAGYIKLARNNTINLENSILMITGNGLKDISALEKWNEEPDIKSYNEWINILL